MWFLDRHAKVDILNSRTVVRGGETLLVSAMVVRKADKISVIDLDKLMNLAEEMTLAGDGRCSVKGGFGRSGKSADDLIHATEHIAASMAVARGVKIIDGSTVGNGTDEYGVTLRARGRVELLTHLESARDLVNRGLR